MRRRWKLVAGTAAAVAVAIQAVPVERTNPPEPAPIAGPAEVVAVLERSCFDCHSYRTRWPWYSRVAPVSWLVARDVSEGRSHLNFSVWEAYPEARRAELRREVWEEVSEGEMPLGIYLVAHRGARLTAADLQVLRAWTLAGRQE